MTTTLLPEKEVPGRRLGRHIHHDPRSRQYPMRAAVEKMTARWKRHLPAFDQGDLGSCTGNAAVGVLGTEPFFSTVSLALGEPLAVQVYSEATVLDEFTGSYLPDDTGSSGLGVAKALKARGLISGYRHVFTEEELHGAIQAGPFIVGTYWYEGMDAPDATGLVHITGEVRGGHEYECLGYDISTDRWTFINSWGQEWGHGGYFSMHDEDFRKLLDNYGDATVFAPNTAPAPIPLPDLTRLTRSFSKADYDLLSVWANARHYTTNKAAADAWKRGTP